MKKKILKISIGCCLVLILIFVGQVSPTPTLEETGATITNGIKEDSTTKIKVEYVSLGIPNINSSFKTFMDYRCVTDENSPQYKFIHQWAWLDYEGFMRCNGERNLGIEDDYYLIALGSYYETEIGTKYRITTDTGNVFYGVLADCKANIHTNSTNQYGVNKDIIEFLVDIRKLNSNIKYHGTVNVYMPLNGSITKIERIDFVEN